MLCTIKGLVTFIYLIVQIKLRSFCKLQRISNKTFFFHIENFLTLYIKYLFSPTKHACILDSKYIYSHWNRLRKN